MAVAGPASGTPALDSASESPALQRTPVSPALQSTSDSPALQSTPDSPALQSTSDSPARQGTSDSPAFGKVFLIGAGPGAQDLITVRGARVLAQAGVVLYDALVMPDMLELCPNAELISVGKRSGQRSMAQTVINEQLVDAARRHALVVRLKGGDPMLFGRADEELRALEELGIEVEVIPGITTALAAAAATKQPLTKRGVARSVAFFTSSTAPEHDDLAAIPSTDTLVQYMGGREAIVTAQRMLDQGRKPETPVLIIENCSRPDQRIVRLTLATLAHGLDPAHGPVLVMLGYAMQRREHQAPDNTLP